MATVLFVYVRNKAISPKNLGMKLSEFPSQPLDQATEMHEKLTSSFTLFVVIFVVFVSQCGRFMIFVSVRFYEKSILRILDKVQKVPF